MDIYVIKRSHATFFSSFKTFKIGITKTHIPYVRRLKPLIETFLNCMSLFTSVKVINLMPQYGYYPSKCQINTIFWDSITKRFPSPSTEALDLQIAESLAITDKAIVWFDESEKDCNTFYPSTKTVRCTFGINFQLTLGPPVQPLNTPKKYDLMYVATNQPRKRLSDFLMISSELFKEGRLKRACLVTNSPGNTYVKEKCPNYHQFLDIETAVDSDTLSQLYQSSRFFLNTSTYEGLGLPNLEAVYKGTPVICYDIPIFHEIFGDFGLFMSAQQNQIKSNIEIVCACLEYSDADYLEAWKRQSSQLAKFVNFDKCYKEISEC